MPNSSEEAQTKDATIETGFAILDSKPLAQGAAKLRAVQES